MSAKFRLKFRRRIGWVCLHGYQYVRILAYRCFSNGKIAGYAPILLQPALISGRGTITFGENVTLGYWPSPSYLTNYCHIEARDDLAEVRIGDGTRINNGVSIVSERASVVIGNNCLIGPGVTILDSDFHGVVPEDRNCKLSVRVGRVEICDNVFIGAGAIVLKGVVIGAGSVVGAGAVVTSSVPPRSVAVGNPATCRPIR